MRKLRVVIAGAGLTVLLAACGNGPPPSVLPSGGAGGAATAASAGQVVSPAPATAAATVKVGDDLKFTPASTSVKVGDTVVWTNGGTLHDITFDDPQGALTHAPFTAGEKYAVKFTTAGTYKYQCTIHGGMTGTIVVQ